MGGRLFARTHRGVPSPSELEPTVTTSLECRVPGAQPSWRVKPSTRDGPGAASPKSTRWIVRPPPSPRPKSKLSGLTSLCTYLYKELNKTRRQVSPIAMMTKIKTKIETYPASCTACIRSSA